MTPRWVGVHMSGKTFLCSPASPPLPACAASALPPWHIGRYWGGGHLRPPTAPTYHIRVTMCVGWGYPPPRWPRCTTRSGIGVACVALLLSPPSPNTAWLESTVVPPRFERKSDTSKVLPQGGILLISQANAIICLLVGGQLPCLYVCSTVWALHPQSLVGSSIKEI